MHFQLNSPAQIVTRKSCVRRERIVDITECQSIMRAANRTRESKGKAAED